MYYMVNMANIANTFNQGSNYIFIKEVYLMKEIICITNQKGGIGKSTTAQAIGAGYSFKGYKTLLIDLDAQCNLTIATGANRTTKGTYELLTQEAPIEQLIQPIKENLDIIPSSNLLSKISTKLIGVGKEFRLKEVLNPILDKYDYIVLDTPPTLSDLTVNALTASTLAVIPAQADLFSIEAIKELATTISVIRKYTNPNLKIAGILLTRYQARSVLTKELTELIDDIAKALHTKVFKARIREAIAIKEAQALNQDIFSYAPKSKVASDYKAFFEELRGMKK